jgi:hypothetical protein
VATGGIAHASIIWESVPMSSASADTSVSPTSIIWE